MTDRRGGTLIIGLGNPDRGDDAAGRAVAARLKARVPRDMRVIECGGEATALLARLGEADEVILVDAAISGAAPGTVERFEAHEAPLPAARFGMSTHGFGLAEAIELARALGQLPRRCVVYAIEGRSFALGDPLSPDVEAAVGTVVARILDAVCEKAG
ncbi:MAG: hydrogenase maturation protease [Roseiarcus sp.]|jgi:hydrogenase maturation protease